MSNTYNAIVERRNVLDAAANVARDYLFGNVSETPLAPVYDKWISELRTNYRIDLLLWGDHVETLWWPQVSTNPAIQDLVFEVAGEVAAILGSSGIQLLCDIVAHRITAVCSRANSAIPEELSGRMTTVEDRDEVAEGLKNDFWLVALYLMHRETDPVSNG